MAADDAVALVWEGHVHGAVHGHHQPGRHAAVHGKQVRLQPLQPSQHAHCLRDSLLVAF